MPAEDTTRALRVGIAGPVGAGKSTLVVALCSALSGELDVGVVANDVSTDEDARFLRAQRVLPEMRIVAVQTGGSPQTAIGDDIGANLRAIAELEADEGPLDVVLVESGGNDLTATFSPALADAQIFVLDAAGGERVPRKGGSGIERADLLVIAKADIAHLVGADLGRMLADAASQREGRPVIAADLRVPDDVAPIAAWVRDRLVEHRAGAPVAADPGPMAPYGHHR